VLRAATSSVCRYPDSRGGGGCCCWGRPRLATSAMPTAELFVGQWRSRIARRGEGLAGLIARSRRRRHGRLDLCVVSAPGDVGATAGACRSDGQTAAASKLQEADGGWLSFSSRAVPIRSVGRLATVDIVAVLWDRAGLEDTAFTLASGTSWELLLSVYTATDEFLSNISFVWLIDIRLIVKCCQYAAIHRTQYQ